LALTLLDIEGVDVNLSDKKGWAPLHWASLNGHKNLTAALLSRGADINKQSEKGTPLHLAALHKRKAITCLLIDKKADCTLQDSDGKIPRLGLAPFLRSNSATFRLLSAHAICRGVSPFLL
jgi:ankyrin repeat protein